MELSTAIKQDSFLAKIVQQQGKIVNGKMQIDANDLLAATDIKSHQDLKSALQRLVNTNIELVARHDSKEEKVVFSLLNGYEIIYDKNDRIQSIEVDLPDWVLENIETQQMH